MAQRLTSSRLANLEANAIYAACAAFQSQFKAITGRARARFAQRDWHGMQADAAERLDIYRQVVEQTVAEIRHAFWPIGSTMPWCGPASRRCIRA